MASKVERRRYTRVDLNSQVAFRKPRESHYLIPIEDLSPHGCRIGCPELLRTGELVWVQLPSLESLPAWVRWTQKAHSGVEFDRPMHRAVFDMMTGRLAPTGA